MKYYLIVFILFINTFVFAQKQKAPTQRNIQLYVNDQSIQATVLLKEKKTKPQEAIDYYWYYNNEIKSNKGGYSGKLLTGSYQVTDKKGNLLEQGFFKKGIKNGVWKTWGSNGELSSINTWKKGIKDGEYKLFQKGKLVEKGSYSKNNLAGKVYKYNADTIISTTKYKNGKVIPEKVKKLKAEKEEKIKNSETEVKDETPKKEKTEKVKKEKNNPVKTTDSEKEKKQKTSDVKNKPTKVTPLENKTKQPKKTKKTTKKEEVKPKQK